ncbi:MAG: hypothetical protein K2X38_24200 [Gemmataceae bacterium]|nr:hypothetical protein [Gemmataceae bacterium]
MPRFYAAFWILLASVVSAQAQMPPEAKSKAGDAAKEVRTRHTFSLDGKKIEYDAVAGMLPLREESKVAANIFYVAYTRVDGEKTKRPITFCFNGGPGSSSVWLHMGAFGPKRVQLTDVGETPPGPPRLIDNEGSILDVTDLVFIDPVSTGFSRAVEEKEAKKFHGVEEDVESIGEFIRLYLTREKRWTSPKLIAGESYGTTRGAALARHLQDRHGIYPEGVLLVSSVLDFQTISFSEGNDLPYSLFLPTYTATAYYHKKLEAKEGLKKLLAESEKFALNEYPIALAKGNRLTHEEKADVAKKLAALTSLSEDYILRADLRIEPTRFRRELLRKEGISVGRFDSRLMGKDGNAIGESAGHDFSYSAVHGAYTAGLNAYLRDELKFESEQVYEILTGRVRPWNYGHEGTNRYLNVTGRLRDAMTSNRHLRVFVANGYYDLATPYFATEHTFAHLTSVKETTDRVTMTYYEAGHMMYIHRPSLQQFRTGVVKFIKN